MQGMKRSLLLSWIESGLSRLRRLLMRSRILSLCREVYPRAERTFRSGRLQVISDREQGRAAWQYRLRFYAMRATEESLLLSAWRRLLSILLATDLATLGTFGILCGVLSAAICLILPPARHVYSSLLLSLILAVSSIPLLQSHKSLSHAIRSSILIGGLLLGFCELSSSRFGSSVRGTSHPWYALLLALFLSGIGAVISPLLLFAALICLLLLLLLWSSPELGALLLLFFFPFLHLTAHPTVILAVGVLFLDLSWITKAICGRRRMRFGVIDLCVALLILSFLLGGAVGAGGRTGLLGGITMATLISFWFPAVNLLSGRRWRRRAVFALKLSSFLCSLYGLYQYLFGEIALKWVDEARFGDLGSRVTGCFSNPNVLAVFLLLTFPFFLVDALNSHRKRRVCLLHFVATGCVCVCLVLTWSRGAWLGILCALLVCSLILERRTAAIVFFAFPYLPFAVLLLPDRVLRRFMSIGSFADSSIRYRLYTWRGVLRLVREHPWGIGVGEAAFARVYPRYAVSGIESVMHAHQMLLQLLVELGISGLLIFLTFSALLFFYAIFVLRGKGEDRPVGVAAASALLGAAVMGAFDILWYQYGMLLLFFAVAAILTAADYEGEAERWTEADGAGVH